MNIEKIKSELECLTQIVSAWSDNNPIAAIERDLALDKLLKIYDLVRFARNNDEKEIETPIVAPIPVAADSTEPKAEPAAEEVDEDYEQSDVEVEFIFADDEQDEPEFDENESNAPAEIEAVELPEIQPDIKPEPAPVVPEPEPKPAPAPTPEPEPAPEPVKTEVQPKEEAQPADVPKARSMNTLFGADEPRRQPRTKHQRMMSIYNDEESRPEKVVDISKIFDLDSDEPSAPAPKKSSEQPATTPKKAATESHSEEKISIPVVETPIDIEPATTIGDVMAQNSQTLADTIAVPTALGEEISHKSIRSLRQGIGLNDKFLMIRDLFDGDGDAYEQTINALDEFDDFDDCIIYIAENFAWNADSEGAKFIMQLLERKLS